MLPHTWSEVFRRYERVYNELLGAQLSAGGSASAAESVLHGGVG
jgi:hypothetical protein